MGLTRRPGTERLVRAAAAAAMLAFASVAHAAPTAADRETARSLMEQGRDLRDKGNTKDALKRFQAANDIMHVPTTALEVAKAQVALGLLVDARDTIATLRQIPSEKDSPIFKTARAAAEALDASLAGRVPAITITVKGAEEGQAPEVTVDGVAVPAGVLGLPRAVNPGHHAIAAKTPRAEGHLEFDVREGEQKPVEVPLEASANAAPPPLVAPETPPPAEGEPASTGKSHAPTTLTWVGIGVAGAGVLAGTITGVMSLSKKSTLSSECPNQVCGPSGYSTLDSANLLATLSDVSFAVAGAGAVLAVVTLAVGHGGGEPAAAPQPPTGRTVRITPWFAGNAAGVGGTF